MGAAEGHKLRSILFGLNLWIVNNEDRHGKEEVLADYIIETKGYHGEWAIKCLGAQLLYLVNVVGQIFFTDCFLGWEFSTYGVNTASFLEESAENRIDPMSRVFPRMAKCTFMKFGPSGTIQNHDAQCVLPINIINEKIYVFLWFWFIFLTVATCINIIWTFAIVVLPPARRIIISRKLWTNPNRKDKTFKNIDVSLIVANMDFADWKLFYQILKNVDAIVFAEFCQHLTEKLQREAEAKLGRNDTLPMKNLLSLDDQKENLNKNVQNSDDNQEKDDSILLPVGDGNYLKSKIESDI